MRGAEVGCGEEGMTDGAKDQTRFCPHDLMNRNFKRIKCDIFDITEDRTDGLIEGRTNKLIRGVPKKTSYGLVFYDFDALLL